MKYRLLSKVLGVLLGLIGLAMGVCAIYAWYGPEVDRADSSRAMGISTGIVLAAGLVLFLIGRGTKNEMLRREAIATVGVSWFLAALAGSLPFMLCEPGLSFVDAFFESMSGFTTTGSTVLEDIEVWPPALLLWRSLTQWLGGIGIVVIFVAVLSFLGVGSRTLMKHESSLNISDASSSRIHDVAVTLMKVYLGLTVACGLGLWWLGMTPFDALNHALTTLSTGGFSTHNASIGHFDSLAIEAWLAVFMLLGSVSYMLYVFVALRKWERIRKEEEAKFYTLLLGVAILAVGIDLWQTADDCGFFQGIRRSFFTIISISTTTGFGTEDYDQWPTFSRLLLLGLMAIGGCAGSTAGGVKMNRIILFAKIAIQELVRSFRPSQVFRLRLNGANPREGARLQTVLFLSVAFGITGVAGLFVAMLEPSLDLASAFGAVLATLFNIGPGMEMLGPTDNYAFLHPTTLLLLSVLMALGRLEFFVVLVLFLPSLWRKY